MSERNLLDGFSHSGLRPWPMRIVQKWCLNSLQAAWPWDSHLNGSPKGSVCVAYDLLSQCYSSITILFTCGTGSSKSLLWISIPALLMYACVWACDAVRMYVSLTYVHSLRAMVFLFLHISSSEPNRTKPKSVVKKTDSTERWAKCIVASLVSCSLM